MSELEMLERLYEKVEQVAQDQGEMKVTLVEQKGILDGQAIQLEQHILRTKLAEENIELLRTDLKPVEKQVAMVHGVFKFIGVLASLAAIGKLIVELT